MTEARESLFAWSRSPHLRADVRIVRKGLGTGEPRAALSDQIWDTAIRKKRDNTSSALAPRARSRLVASKVET